MSSDSARQRRPWLAALLTLLFPPLGHVYAGAIRRGIVLWLMLGLALPLAVMILVLLCPVSRMVLVMLVVVTIAALLWLPVDAWFSALRNRNAEPKRYQRGWCYLILLIVFQATGVLTVSLFRPFVAEAFLVPYRAMLPTIQPGDRIMVQKIAFNRNKLARNDLIAFYSDGPDSIAHVARIIGLPGDEIKVVADEVFRNGKPFLDPHKFIDDDVGAHEELSNCGPVTVPADSVFVMGDNRLMSLDSRMRGPLPLADVFGNPRLIFFSNELKYRDTENRTDFKCGDVQWDRIGLRFD